MYAAALFGVTGVSAFIGWIADNNKETATKQHTELTRVITASPMNLRHTGQIVAFRGSASGEPLRIPHLNIDVINYKIKHYTESIEFNPITKRLENNSVYTKTTHYGEKRRWYLQDRLERVEVTELPQTDIKFVKLGEHFERIEDNGRYETHINWNSSGLSITTSDKEPHSRIIGEKLIYEGLPIGTELTAIGRLHVTNDDRMELLSPGSISQTRLETQIEEARLNAESSTGSIAWNIAKCAFVAGLVCLVFCPGRGFP